MMKIFTDDGTLERQTYRAGDTVRCRDNGDKCVVIWSWRDWLWLDPIDYRDAAPFTGRTRDYELAGRA
jgi:hypothetical protein